MAVDGVRQLKTLTLTYCKWSGSSVGMRDLIKSDRLRTFSTQNEHLSILTLQKSNSSPTLIAEYQNGHKQVIGCKNIRPDDILNKIMFLNEKRGTPARTWHEQYRRVTSRPSIQGAWHPDDWLHLYVMKEGKE
eukprot:TRINITY_DN4533_c0_g1_i6.p1 TRINITY_DN4533_c0_g1~~TRINITY_DN4533_c0_g1_i6.p1  ORF type:complete len:133 (-),score=16.83 TRINITY_DN4533_c0_g1_i6:42-440(-)